MATEWLVIFCVCTCGVLLWKAFDTITTLFDPKGRKTEKAELLELIDKLCEKNKSPDPIGTYQLHSRERMEAIRQDGITQRETLKKPHIVTRQAIDGPFEDYESIAHE